MTISDLAMPLSVPLPDVFDAPSSIIIERVQPEIDAGRYPVKRVAGDILEVSADIFKDGHDKIAAVVKYRRARRRRRLAGSGDAAGRQRPLGRRGAPAGQHPLRLHRSRPFPTAGRPGGTRSRRRSPPGRTSRSSCSKDAPSSPRRCRAPTPDDREVLEEAIAAIDGQRQPGGDRAPCSWRRRSRPRCGAPARGAVGPSMTGSWRSSSTAPPPASPPGTRCFPARRAPTRPASATFAEAGERLPAIAEMGFDVVYLTPIHPIGTRLPQGEKQHPGGRAGRSRRPLRHRQRRGRTRRHRTGSRHARRFPRLRRPRRGARHGGRPRRRDPGLAGSPLGEGAPGVVHHPPRRHDPLRREPAQEVPGHLPASTSTPPAGASSGWSCGG